MVTQPTHLIGGAFYHGSAEQLHRRQLLMSMTLHIGLGQYIQTILVAKVVEHRIVGIVRRTHSIDIETFHRLDVFFHLFSRDGTSIYRAEVMTVYAMEHHALAVNGQSTV